MTIARERRMYDALKRIAKGYQTPDRIITEFIYPPIPVRCCDWSAHRESYDGAEDSHSPIGYGPDEASAIADLLSQEADRVE